MQVVERSLEVFWAGEKREGVARGGTRKRDGEPYPNPSLYLGNPIQVPPNVYSLNRAVGTRCMNPSLDIYLQMDLAGSSNLMFDNSSSG